MKTIRLYGDLAARFGREHRLDVRSPAEAVRALSVLLPGFMAYWRQNAQRRYKVFVGSRNIASPRGETLAQPCSDREVIRIAPILAGASAGVRFVVGAIIAAVAYSPWGQAFGGAYWGQIGVGLMLGAVVEMLSPTPKTPGISDGNERKPSYNFNGAVNTIAQGHPVPVCYGRLRVGSAVISASLRTA